MARLTREADKARTLQVRTMRRGKYESKPLNLDALLAELTAGRVSVTR